MSDGHACADNKTRNSLAINGMQVMDVLCSASEYDELPVRPNEDRLNATLSQELRFPLASADMGSPHTKANLILQVCARNRLAIITLFMIAKFLDNNRRTS